ncbi:MAG: hypothetical protein KF705_00670 [Phycisphaeraceae bacterium]|nr:hypothetical protein [Phycisphaeraceae bacterium]
MSHTPGTPAPQSPDFIDLPADPPVWPKVFGIISIVFGTLGLVCGGCGLAVMPFMGQLMGNVAEGQDLPPAYQPNLATMAYAGVGLLHAILLLIAGAVTVARKPVGRPLHLVYAALGIPLAIGGLFIQWKLQQENIAWAAQADPNNPFAQQFNSPQSRMGNMLGMAFGAAMGLGYPLFLLVWFGLVKRKGSDMGQLPEYL